MASFPQERRSLIFDRLRSDGRVTLRGLVQDFAVSEDTIRRDLRELEERGHCKCVYGGALANTAGSNDVLTRRTQLTARKERLGRALCGLIKPGQVVFFDAGSTNLAAARHLPQRRDITAVTHDPAIAAALASHEQTKVISIGGQINHFVGAALDAAAMRSIASIRPDLLLLGCCAFAPDKGMMAFNYEDAEIKQRLIHNSASVATAVVTDKIGTAAPYTICDTEDVSDICLETDAPEDLTSALSAKGIRLHLSD